MRTVIASVAIVLFSAVLASAQPPPATGAEVKTKSGLRYIDIRIGKGVAAEHGRRVRIIYTGWLPNGNVFDQRNDRTRPYEFDLGERKVIQGFEEGLVGLRVGGKRRLIIPPKLGYGATRQQGIPPNSELTFDVELISVSRPRQ